MTDTIHRFIFDNYGIRGELVRLAESSQQMVEAHQYPAIISNLLQQAATVNVLLASTLKFEGKISLQLQTGHNLKMLTVQTTHELDYRGVARFEEEVDYSELSFTELTRDGQMCITIEPLKGKRYQGIVSLEGEDLAQCVESYFAQSEQLKTRIWLYNDANQVFGLMLQALPDMSSEDDFMHLEHLASTLSPQECFSVDSETLLHRLFHQELVNNLAINTVQFKCGCNQKKMLDSLILIGNDEISEILQQEGEIAVTCEFCLNQFAFSEIDIKQHQGIKGNSTHH